MQIAQTIQTQLGGSRFSAMTGARDFVGGSNFLQFSIGRGAKNKANKVRVTLEANDTYTVEFFRVVSCNVRTVGEAHGVYASGLQATFTNATGMDTKL